jgi:hypothetical protein
MISRLIGPNRAVNSQPVRAMMAREILTRGRIERIIETGTFLGPRRSSSRRPGLPGFTVEFDPCDACSSNGVAKRSPITQSMNRAPIVPG